MTVVGTRPEIIRLSATIKKLDALFDQVLVHTGQNYDYELNQVFFNDLGLRSPDLFLEADTSSLGSALGSILARTEKALRDAQPDAFLVLGDTNSCVSALMAKRMRIPVYHMEAGNRCFDERVPEETNRRLIDHISDYNLAYTELARRNLLAEGIHPSRVTVTGSPMREVIEGQLPSIDASSALADHGLEANAYVLASVHREENVDEASRLKLVLESLLAVRDSLGLSVHVSTHPRTSARLSDSNLDGLDGIVFHKPFGFNDYLQLQRNARVVISDSGTISEESAIMRFPAVTLRDHIERPEAIDTGSIVATGLEPRNVVRSVKAVLGRQHEPGAPVEYLVRDTSHRVANFILSTVGRRGGR